MQQILVYSDSLSWGIIPTTRRRLPFDARWPGVMEIALAETHHSVRVIEDCLNGRRTVWEDPFKPGRNGLTGLAQRIEIAPPPILIPRGPIAAKFTDAAGKAAGLADAYRNMASELGCHFFDAGSVTPASTVDGIHLDADQHARLGGALASFVAGLPGFAPSTPTTSG